MNQPACKNLMVGWEVALATRDDEGATFDNVGVGDAVGLLKGFNTHAVATGDAPEGVSFLNHVLAAAGNHCWRRGRDWWIVNGRGGGGWQIDGVDGLVRGCVGIINVGGRDAILVGGSGSRCGRLVVESRARSEEGDWSEQ